MFRMIVIIAVILLIQCAVLAQGNRYGVFVGIGKYPNEAEILVSSGNDATEMCKTFSPDCGNSNNTKLLKDEQATREAILQSIIYYQKIIGKDDLFVFYYSGHGTLFPDRFSAELDEKFSTKIFKNGSTLKNSPQSGKTEKFDAALVTYNSSPKFR